MLTNLIINTKYNIMKKVLTIAACLAAAIMVCMPAYSQKKKKETSKERKERIAKMVNDGASHKNIYVSIFRCFNKNNNFNFNYQTIGSGTINFIDLTGDRISCNLPFEGLADSKSRQAYSLSNTDISIIANNQITTIIGGWNEKQKSYLFRSIFWNNDTDKDSQAIQITMTIQVYPSGKVYAMVEVPGFESMSYEGEVVERPAPDENNPLTD